MTTFPAAVIHTLSGAHDPDGPHDPPIHLAVHEQGEGEDRPAVVFCHGFPELAYSWRHQLPMVADAGFRAIAPDQRGYGASSAPGEVAAYGLGQLCGDLADLLDTLEIDKAVFVGHDWGGFVAWAMPVLHPDRVAGVAGICTPYTPFPGTDFLRSMFGDDEKMYMLWFQEPGVAEAVMDPRVRMTFEKLMVGGVDPAGLLEAGKGRAEGMDFNPFRRIEELDPPGEPVATPEEIDHYVEVVRAHRLQRWDQLVPQHRCQRSHLPGRRHRTARHPDPDDHRRMGSRTSARAGGQHGNGLQRPGDAHDLPRRPLGDPGVPRGGRSAPGRLDDPTFRLNTVRLRPRWNAAGQVICLALYGCRRPDKRRGASTNLVTITKENTMSLNVGDPAPDFTLGDTEGDQITLSSFRGKKSVTLVFIPFAFTSVCKGELCEIRDNLNSFKNAGNEMLAITCDRKPSLAEWKRQEDFNFTMLSDGWPHGEVARSYGCFNEDLGCAERMTVVIDRDGNIADSFASGGLGEARSFDSYTNALSKL